MRIRLLMANDNCPYVFGLCEPFLNKTTLGNQVAITGFDLIRKDRDETQDKSGGGIILYFRNTLKFKRRPGPSFMKLFYNMSYLML